MIKNKHENAIFLLKIGVIANIVIALSYVFLDFRLPDSFIFLTIFGVIIVSASMLLECWYLHDIANKMKELCNEKNDTL